MTGWPVLKRGFTVFWYILCSFLCVVTFTSVVHIYLFCCSYYDVHCAVWFGFQFWVEVPPWQISIHVILHVFSYKHWTRIPPVSIRQMHIFNISTKNLEFILLYIKSTNLHAVLNVFSLENPEISRRRKITEFTLLSFLYARLKKWDVLWEHMQRAGGVQSIYPLNSFNYFHCIIIKLCENVYWQNISAKYDNQPYLMKHFWVMVLI